MANEYGNYDIFKKIAEQEEEQTMIPEPPTGIELTDEVNRSEVDKLALIKKFMGMSDPASVEPTSTQGDPAAMTPPVEMPIAPPIVTPKPQIIPEAPIQDQLSARQQERKDIQDLLAKARQERSMTEGLAGITSGIKRAAAAYGGGGLTQIKADTGMEDQMIKSAGRDYKEAVSDQKTKTENAKLDEAERRDRANAEVYRTLLKTRLGDKYKDMNFDSMNASDVIQAGKMMSSLGREKSAEELALMMSRTGYYGEKAKSEPEKLKLSQEKHSYKIGEDEESDIMKFQNKIEKHPQWKAGQEVKTEMSALDKILEDAHKKGGPSVSALGARLAKAMGERGVLTDQDVVRYVKRPAWLSGAVDSMSKGTMGQISDGQYEDIKRMLGQMDEAATDKISVARKENVDQYVSSRENKEKLGYDKAYERLVGQSQGKTKANHPQESEAMKWAKANPEDPRAIKILQRLGQ